jgi:hypothetical protein
MKRKLACLTALSIFLLAPVNDALSQVSPEKTFFFPQLAAGQGGGVRFDTVYVAVNPSATTAQITFEFFDDNGSPLAVVFANVLTDEVLGTGSSVQATLGPNATRPLVARVDGAMKTGWTRVSSSTPIWVSSLFQMQAASNGDLLSSVGVPASAQRQEFTIVGVRLAEEDSVLETGIALANPTGAAANVTGTFFDWDGVQVAQQVIPLPARGHVARFVGELFPGIGAAIVGKIVLTSSTPFLVTNLMIQGSEMTSTPVFGP